MDDKGYVVFDEFFVERRIGVGGAVGGDEQLCAVKIRRVYRHELYLNRPLAQSALHFGGLAGYGIFFMEHSVNAVCNCRIDGIILFSSRRRFAPLNILNLIYGIMSQARFPLMYQIKATIASI